MDRAKVPLVEFYRSLLPTARAAGYKVVLTALAREADAPTFYADLRRYWTSLHDLTGTDILFVLAGANAAQELDDPGIRSKTEPVIFSTADLAVARSRRDGRELEWTGPSRSDRDSFTALLRGTPTLTSKDDYLAQQHTLEVTALRRHLGVTEAQLPCLAATLLRDSDLHDAPFLIPFVTMARSDVYSFIRDLTCRIEPWLLQIDQTGRELVSLQNQLDIDSRHLRDIAALRASIRTSRSLAAEPVRKDAASTILNFTGLASRTDAHREECFDALQRVRSRLQGQNGAIADLRRLIDWSFLPRVSGEAFDTYDRPVRHSAVSSRISEQRGARDRVWTGLESSLRALAFSSVPAPISRPIRVFYSYATPDRQLRDALETHLMPLRREGLIEMWHDQCVTPGDAIAPNIRFELERADVVLLLISADFLASERCYDNEFQHALELHRTGRLHLMPILLRPVDLSSSLLGGVRTFPANGVPVTQWEDRDAAWTDVARGLRHTIPLIDESRYA